MQRKKTNFKTPRIRLVGWDVPVGAAVAVASLAGSTAIAAPGDLDPAFGEVGRVFDITPAGYAYLTSVDVRDDEAVFFGGGGEYDYYTSYVDDFVGGLLPDGTPDAGFAAATLNSTAVYDTALQPDGKLVGVGVAIQPDGNKKLLIFRMLTTGALDPGFGLNGLVLISDGTGSREAGYSILVDPDGSLVVAGDRGGNLLVARTLPNGTLDGGFGTGGVHVGPAIVGYPRLGRVATGGYRLSVGVETGGATGPSQTCQVVALTESGTADAAFGAGGLANVPGGLSAGSRYCTALVVQPDGRTVVVGQSTASQPFISRLQASGAVDPGFDASSVLEQFASVSALGLGETGNLFVAGADRSGFYVPLVARASGNGALDTAYGRAGSVIVEPELRGGIAYISDLKLVADDRVVVGGNFYELSGARKAFVARLLGDTDGAGPGVFSFTQQRVLATEQGAQAVLTVRRTGGSSGAVAVNYATQTFPRSNSDGSTYAPGEAAVADTDYTTSSGRLTWADGDDGERQIVVPIAADAQAEVPEWFEVALEAPEGGAGLGSHGAEVEIAGASYPYGEFTLSASSSDVTEGVSAGFVVSRDYYGQGAVSVKLRVAAGGTATPGSDFRSSGSTDWQDVVLTWADGEWGGKHVEVPTVADSIAEATESFTLEIVEPTGGAILGRQTQATAVIRSPTAEPEPPKSRNGGGAFGWLGAVLLALAGALRRARRPHGGVTRA